jgi:23S rRNA maturation-related 3'-5' exoribonuclease YhaM
VPLNPHSNFNKILDIELYQFNLIEYASEFLGMIERPGINKLIDYLFESDYLTAPASTRFHNVFEYGLLLHSLNVTKEFFKENEKFQKPLPHESVILCGLLHDLCKVGAYTETARGYEKVKDFPNGHAKLSISRIEEFIKLTKSENNVILFHMSMFGIYTYHEYSAWDMYKAVVETPQVQIFAAIDMMDSKRKVDATQGRRA